MYANVFWRLPNAYRGGEKKKEKRKKVERRMRMRGRGWGGREGEQGREMEVRRGRVKSNEVGWQVEREEELVLGVLVVVGSITYSAGVFGSQLIKRRRGEMQKG